MKDPDIYYCPHCDDYFDESEIITQDDGNICPDCYNYVDHHVAGENPHGYDTLREKWL